MPDFDEIISKVKANKKILIPAAIIGGAAGLYVLSKNGGLGGGGLPVDGGGLPGGGGGGGSTDQGAGFQEAITQLESQLAKIQEQNADAITQVVEGQTSFQDKITSSIASIVSQMNDALSKQQADVNAAIANLPQPQNVGFNGLDSLFDQMQAFQLPNPIQNAPQFGGKSVEMSQLSGELSRKVGFNNNPQTSRLNTHSLASIAQQGSRSIQSAFSGINTRSIRPVNRPSPSFLRNPFSGTNFASGFNKLSGGSKGVPFNIGNTYVPYTMGRLKVPAKSPFGTGTGTRFKSPFRHG